MALIEYAPRQPNLGYQASTDKRVSASDTDGAYAIAARLAAQIARVPGVADSHVFRIPNDAVDLRSCLRPVMKDTMPRRCPDSHGSPSASPQGDY